MEVAGHPVPVLGEQQDFLDALFVEQPNGTDNLGAEDRAGIRVLWCMRRGFRHGAPADLHRRMRSRAGRWTVRASAMPSAARCAPASSHATAVTR
jgi:hypothetical protein